VKPFESASIVYKNIVLVTVTFYIARTLALIHARHVEYLKLIMAEFATLKDLNFGSTNVK
jgi:hypothetical protein